MSTCPVSHHAPLVRGTWGQGSGQLVAAGYAELGVDALQVVLHGPRRQVRPGRDLLAASARGCPCGYLALAPGQPLGLGASGKTRCADLAAQRGELLRSP